MKPAFDTPPAWLAVELAASPADRAVLVEARRQIEAEFAAEGGYALSAPNVSDLIHRRAAQIRETRRQAQRAAARPTAESRWITTDEAARRLGMSRQFVTDHLNGGDHAGLVGHKEGAHWCVDAVALDRYLARVA